VAAQAAPSVSVGKPAAKAPAAQAEHVSSDPVVEVHPSIFAENYSEAAYKASNPDHEDPEAAKQVRAELSMGGPDASLLGKLGGIGAGLLGTTFLGYFVYAGMKGSHDLMYPEKSDFFKTPDAYGAPYETVAFHAHDGLNLSGWYVPAAVPTTKAIVIFHGHGSNKDTVYRKYGQWLHAKYNLFLYDSRYHGQSEGKFTTLGYYERKDAQIALDLTRAHGNNAIGVLGESMGGAVAIEATAADKGVKACLSDCAFDSLQDAIAPRAKLRGYPMPTAVGFAVVKTASIRAKGKLDSADPIKFVDQIAPRPLLIVHGQKDDETTPDNGEKLFAAAKEPKEIWRTPEAKHAESVDKYPDEYKARALAFFDKAL
jgi:fermentation-respiration switch protein FrsA (DUF1100 family)